MSYVADVIFILFFILVFPFGWGFGWIWLWLLLFPLGWGGYRGYYIYYTPKEAAPNDKEKSIELVQYKNLRY